MVIKCCCAGTAHEVAAPRCGARTAQGAPPGGAAGPRAQVRGRSRGRCGAGEGALRLGGAAGINVTGARPLQQKECGR